MTFPNNPPGRTGIKNNAPRGPQLRELFWGFIANAEYYGLPVKFLKVVGKSYTLKTTARFSFFSEQHTNVATNRMYLDRTTYDLLVNMNVDLPLNEATAIEIAYHESTHAYLDLKENKAAFKAFIAEGEKHYKDAPMVNGKTSSDPGRLFQEAAASYVGDRAARWWLAFEMLAALQTIVANGDVPKDRLVQKASDVRLNYNNAMKKMVFGYEKETWYRSGQVYTKRPISTEMKRFLDAELLEDKIPDDFDKVTKLQQLYLDLLSPGRP